MLEAPRCREWTPLATQQLRLRTLIQIVGYNIRPPEWCRVACSFYYTLHCTTMSAPFYTSEKISSPHPKWRELHSELTQNMSSTNVVIRIWCHLLQDSNEEEHLPSDIIVQTWGVYFNGLRLIGANLALDFTPDSFKTNTLVFQMHGGYFCSYRSLNLEVIPSENLYELNSISSGSSDQPAKSDTQRIPIEANFLQNHRIIKESRSISPNKGSWRSDAEYSKSESPVERGFKQTFARDKTSSISISEKARGSQVLDNHAYEQSPDHLDIKEFSDFTCDTASRQSKDLSRSQVDLSETAENYDLRKDDIPKCRYLCLNFLKSEIRPSYNATKLQKLHLLQYDIKKRKEAVHDIKERIYRKSAMENDDCLTESPVHPVKAKRSQRNLFSPDQGSESDSDKSAQSSLGNKSRSSNRGRTEDFPVPSNGPRLTLKLNDLLSYKTKPSPHQRSEHARLTRQLEILRFKKIILSDERDSKLANIRRLKERHAKLYEENQDMGTELMQRYHSLSRRTELLKETRQSTAALRQLASRSHAALVARRNRLLADLQQIFYIQNVEEKWRICDIALPISGEEGGRRATHASESAAAGLAAQCCSVAATLLSQPLRYRLLLLGSATKILDHLTPELPDPQIPLFARGGDPTLFRYAMFLLNKCVGQLLWGCGQPVPDVRPTLANLQRLLSLVHARNCLMDTSKLFGSCGRLAESPPPACAHSQSLRSLVASERGKHRQFNRFKDAVDGQPPSLVSDALRHRHSRSVGSYRDDREIQNLHISTTSVMGSEPFLHEVSTSDERLSRHSRLLKTHNSDSEISRISIEQAKSHTENKVSFILGDDTNLESIKPTLVVKMSTDDVVKNVNDQDDRCKVCMEDNVKKICTEINDYWTEESKNTAASLRSDIAKHMADVRKTSQDTEDGAVESCESCSENADGMCTGVMCSNEVVDVIVIPSAEAKIDTGQNQKLYEGFGGYSDDIQ